MAVADIKLDEWRRRIASVPQAIKIFNGTILENIALGSVQAEAEAVLAMCKQYGFDSWFHKLPQGYLTVVGEEGVNLSGGQQQLVGLARALYQKPELLLLDEPTSALDRQTEQFVLTLLNRLRNEMAVVMVTRRSQSVRIADRVYALEDGILLESSMAGKESV